MNKKPEKQLKKQENTLQMLSLAYDTLCLRVKHNSERKQRES